MKLELAFKDKNSEAVEVALYDKPVNDPHYIEILVTLLGEDWHTSHENIARYIQLLKPESAVPVLLSVATKKLSYLEYDNSLGLSRKCTWALSLLERAYNNQLVFAPSVLGRLHFTRSSLRFSAPQQKR